MDVFLHILSELNVTTHNIVYLLMGCALSTFIIKSNRRISPTVFLYDRAQIAFNIIRSLDDNRLYQVFNSTVIRCICILAHDGKFAKKDTAFIDREIDELLSDDINKKQMVKDTLIRMIEDVIEFEEEYNNDGITIIAKLLRLRRRGK